MHKLIRGEIYRLFHKKSAYIYFCAVLIGYFLITFIRSGGFNEESVVKDAINLFLAFPVLAGGFFFAAIYTDDLNSRNLTTLVGYGIKKAKIILAKFIIMVIFSGIFFSLLPLFHNVLYALFGSPAAPDQMAMIYAVSLKFLLMTLIYSIISSIVVYGSQKVTFAVVTYLLLAFSVVDTLINAISNILELNIAGHLVPGLTDRIMVGIISGAPLAFPVLEYFFYIAVSLTLSIIAFHKKEMEF